MSDRYTRRPSDGEWVCATCGVLVGNQLAHDLFHDRFNLMYDAIPVSMIETSRQVTATDWQAAHDAGEDEELFPGAARTCALCGHQAVVLGGSVTEPGQPTVHLCHGCDEDHDCYRRWTVHGVRPHTDYCRDLLCGGCEEVVDDVPHHDDCECGDCACTQNPYQHADPCDCDDCRAKVMHNYEPPVGSVARCTGCGNVYVHQASGWVDTDDLRWGREWADIAHSFCGPVKVIYNPEEGK